MYYEINVSHKVTGHFFATAERSINHRRHLAKVYVELAKHFTEERGYKLQVSYWPQSGEIFSQDQIDKVLSEDGEIL
mgnify:CR=1 FL=1|jgi:hypothetical protein